MSGVKPRDQNGVSRSQGDRRQRQNRKHDMPGASLNGIGGCQPPDVVPMRILEARERQLRSFAGRGLGTHPADERLERPEVVGDRCRSKPVVERVLTKRALRPIDRGEDFVEIQINPGPFVERLVAARAGDTGDV